MTQRVAGPEPARTAAHGLTVRESRPTPYQWTVPPPGAPNVVAIILDDTGFGHLGCFGSDIATPHMDTLAAGGLRYNRFHVTSLCSATRASFLTGRNHHAVGMGFLADIPLGFPGYTARIPKSAATLPHLLRQGGYSTLAVGKWHLTPRFERSAAGPFDHWPLGLGFERYYGFLQGDTNQWTPNLVQDNHYREPPGRPEDGYHLSEDLADQAIGMVLDQQQAAPGKPFFLYFALGAMHAPHHVRPEWVEPYRGRFDDGWEAWRRRVFERQQSLGIVPEGTVLTPRPSWVPDWEALSEPERRMHARMQEVFAGFLTHTDAQIGRLLQFLDGAGLSEDTIVLLFSDNGASAEGGQTGSVNEHRFTARIPESMEDNLAAYDDWGGFRTYNHYSWGWAWAGNTPHRLWKRYTWLGGTRTPLIVRWPAGLAARGDVRSQFCHAIDLMPTVLDACGITVPTTVDGVTQQPVDGASLRTTFEDPAAPDRRDTQYFEMLGSRSIVHQGWKATTDHVLTGVLDEEALMEGSRDFDTDHWGLFHLDEDFSESTDLADQHPDRVQALAELWRAEAKRNNVLPIDDNLTDRMAALILPAYPAGQRKEIVPGGGPVHDESLPFLFAGFRATVHLTMPHDATAAGVLFALGDRHGGYALFVTEGRLAFALSRAGLLTEVAAPVPVPTDGGTVGVAYTAGDPEAPERAGALTLLHGDVAVASVPVHGPLPAALQHGGAGLRVGYDQGFPVSDRYQVPALWNGHLERVVIEAPGAAPPPVAEELRAALHGD